MLKISDIITKSSDYKKCFESLEGQRVLKDLMNFCKYRDTSFIQGDPHSTAFNEGMRRVFLRVVKFLNMTEEELEKINKLRDGE